jgi:hypothetical protein
VSVEPVNLNGENATEYFQKAEYGNVTTTSAVEIISLLCAFSHLSPLCAKNYMTIMKVSERRRSWPILRYSTVFWKGLWKTQQTCI